MADSQSASLPWIDVRPIGYDNVSRLTKIPAEPVARNYQFITDNTLEQFKQICEAARKLHNEAGSFRPIDCSMVI